jgi:predicted DCC family thiol-disulfide oxidoreductase YuxK
VQGCCWIENIGNEPQKSAKTMNSDVNSPILLFDGVCNLCNASVQWVLLHDRKGIFRFAALQSEAGQALLRAHGLPTDQLNSAVLLAEGRVWLRSDASLELLRRLGGPWRLLSALRYLPRWLRHPVYDWVARNRYRWFGRQTQCFVPRKEWQERFILM